MLFSKKIRIKAIKGTFREERTKWLIYWIIYTLFGTFEFFDVQFLTCNPLYTLSKRMILLWLMVPSRNGGILVFFYRIIRQFLLNFIRRLNEIRALINNAINRIFATE
jgi:receptor expression-enhancing protein 5/6